jgi:type I restriction enzyme R subunit
VAVKYLNFISILNNGDHQMSKVKQNASIDWTIKESVKAKLKVIVKRTLRQYGYPPDMQKLATETVLKQAELIANELTKEE